MSLLIDQISKAEERAAGLDLVAETERCRVSTPLELNNTAELKKHEEFLRESLGNTRTAKKFHERIIHGNELQDVNYFARGARAAQAVGRVVIRRANGRQEGYGTGFLIAPGVLLTNNHVLPAPDWALRSEIQFQFEHDINGKPLKPMPFSLLPDELFHTSEELDFTVVAVARQSETEGPLLESYGYLPLIETTGKAVVGEWLSIIQHPDGERKQTCVRENQLLKVAKQVLWYSTDTLGGSSGAPVYNNDWLVVAIHHSGVPVEKDGRIQTLDGRDWDETQDGEEKIKWQANEGIRISLIVKAMRERLGHHPLLQPIFNATPAEARAAMVPSPARPPFSYPAPLSEKTLPSPTVMNPRIISVRLEIDENNQIRLASGSSAHESTIAVEATGQKEKKPAPFDVPFDTDYSKRNGFQPEMLGVGKLRVNLPKLSVGLKSVVSPLLDANAKGDPVLNYHNYSVVMHAKRRFAIYSAASIRGDQRYLLTRSEYSGDPWKPDPRIALEHQITDFYYRANRFDRGHLSRNEDLEFGTSRLLAMQSAIDTCHYTNCVPQHDKFNRGSQLWQGIEKHIFEKGIKLDEFHTQVITGPILEEDDPVYKKLPDIPYPVRFWKVVVALDSKAELFATAYILDQSATITEFGLDEAAREIPFDEFKTYQVKISEVERLTGLTFTSGKPAVSLSLCDPLEKGLPKRRRTSGSGFRESTCHRGVNPPDGYLPLDDGHDIIL